MDNTSLRAVGISGTASVRAVKLARLARQAGLDGVVASPQEVRAIRRACGKEFLIVVPGIRPQVGEVRDARQCGKKTIKRGSRLRRKPFVQERIIW